MSENQNDHTTTPVWEIPKCGLCKRFNSLPTPDAVYDAKTVMGPWAYLCQGCFDDYGVGLGLGKGQLLVLTEREQANLPEDPRDVRR